MILYIVLYAFIVLMPLQRYTLRGPLLWLVTIFHKSVVLVLALNALDKRKGSNVWSMGVGRKAMMPDMWRWQQANPEGCG